MPPPRPLRVAAPCNECNPTVDAMRDQSAAMREHAAAVMALAKAVSSSGGHLKKLEPVGEFFGAANERLDKLCAWLRKWGVMLLYLAPWVLVTIGAVTPSAGQLFKGLVNSLFGYILH